jgi:hypothetical protein
VRTARPTPSGRSGANGLVVRVPDGPPELTSRAARILAEIIFGATADGTSREAMEESNADLPGSERMNDE